MSMRDVSKTKTQRVTIDATGKNLGRLAVEIADLLRGKNDPSFLPHVVAGSAVTVTNTDKINVTQKKRDEKLYTRHSGYPGGIKHETLGSLMERDSREVVRRAVYGMLPKNKLRDRFITYLTLYRGEGK